MRRTAEDKQAFVAARAEQMKAAPTPAGEAMWRILEPLGFVQEWPLHGRTKNGGEWHYIADFYYASWNKKIVVEVDGSSHRNRKGRDRRRDRRLRGEGINTVRFNNNDVLKYPESVERQVREALGLGHGHGCGEGE